MRFHSVTAIPGPSAETARPVLSAVLELGDLGGRETREFAGFDDALLTLLPGLREHQCEAEADADFVEALQRGTFFCHVVEHVARELSTLAGWPVTFGRTRMVEPPARYRIVVEYSAEHVMRAALEATVDIVESVVEGIEVPLEDTVRSLRAIGTRTEPGPSTNAVLDAARERGIPVTRRSDDGTLWQLGYGSRLRMLEGSATSRTGQIAAGIANDKERTRVLLRAAGIPVPEG